MLSLQGVSNMIVLSFISRLKATCFIYKVIEMFLMKLSSRRWWIVDDGGEKWVKYYSKVVTSKRQNVK